MPCARAWSAACESILIHQQQRDFLVEVGQELEFPDQLRQPVGLFRIESAAAEVCSTRVAFCWVTSSAADGLEICCSPLDCSTLALAISPIRSLTRCTLDHFRHGLAGFLDQQVAALDLVHRIVDQ
jgi:hypothetical protein